MIRSKNVKTNYIEYNYRFAYLTSIRLIVWRYFLKRKKKRKRKGMDGNNIQIRIGWEGHNHVRCQTFKRTGRSQPTWCLTCGPPFPKSKSLDFFWFLVFFLNNNNYYCYFFFFFNLSQVRPLIWGMKYVVHPLKFPNTQRFDIYSPLQQ